MSELCTVVIATRNRPEHLEECLAAVTRQECAFGYSVLVVDNAPENDKSAQVASRHHVGYIMEPRRGLSYARNTGVAASRSEFIAFIDDDSIASPDWLENLLKPFEHNIVMATTGRICVFEEHDGQRIPVAEHHFDLGTQTARIDRAQDNWFALANFRGSGSGGNMAFRRKFFEDFRGFDERLGRGAGLQSFEESHAFFQLIEHGYSLVYVPSAIVHHPDSDLRPVRYPSTTSYMTMLCFEHPKYVFTLFRYVMRRFWQIERSGVRRRGKSLLPWLAGPFQYLAMRARLGNGRKATKSESTDENAMASARSAVSPFSTRS